MIINYPTGLYSSVLPKEPQDSQNVTYLISTTAPPRTSLLFPKIPFGVAIRQRTPREYTTVQRRETVGDLVYTVSNASRQQPGNNANQYEVGEVLEFDYSGYKKVDPMLVSNKTDIQHNLNMFNYEELGLTESDVAIIDEESLRSFDALAQRLNELRVLRSSEEVSINTNQKIINEATKNINALQIMAQDSTSTDADILDLIEKLVVRKAEAELALQESIANANAYAEEASEQLTKLRTIATVLK
jgi:hypothetical protein